MIFNERKVYGFIMLVGYCRNSRCLHLPNAFFFSCRIMQLKALWNDTNLNSNQSLSFIRHFGASSLIPLNLCYLLELPDDSEPICIDTHPALNKHQFPSPVYWSGSLEERANRICIYKKKETYFKKLVIILRNMQLWRLASPKSSGWASILEAQRRANTVIQV